MRIRVPRSRRRRILVIGATLVAIVLGSWFARTVPVEIAIVRFKLDPSQEAVDRLARAVDCQSATRSQGERILKLLFDRDVCTRQRHPVGQWPMVFTSPKYDFALQHSRYRVDQELWSHGKRQCGSLDRGTKIRSRTRCFFVAGPVTHTPTEYDAEIRHHCRLTAPARKQTLPARIIDWIRSKLPGGGTRRASTRQEEVLYESTFTVPGRITVTNTEEADKVHWLSGPDLDHIMRQSWRVCVDPTRTKVPYVTPAGLRACTPATRVCFDSLPCPVGFEYVLRLADGRELKPVREPGRRGEPKEYEGFGHVAAHRGSSGGFRLTPAHFLIEEPGTYEGTFVFRPDREMAFRDPVIEAIWNGTLELPVTFTITREPPPRSRPPPYNGTTRTMPATKGQTP